MHEGFSEPRLIQLHVLSRLVLLCDLGFRGKRGHRPAGCELRMKVWASFRTGSRCPGEQRPSAVVGTAAVIAGVFSVEKQPAVCGN